MQSNPNSYYTPLKADYILIALLVMGLALFARLYTTNFFIPAFHFYNDSIFLSVLSNGFSQAPVITVALLTIAIGTGLVVLILGSWERVSSTEIRTFILIVAAIVVFRNVTYEYNYIYDQTHTFDRLALIAIFLLSIWRPVFLLLIPLATFCLQSQFQPDFGAYSLAQISMPIKILFCFSMCMIWTVLTKKQYNQTIVWVCAIVILIHYWVPAYAKYSIDWHSYGQIHNMFAASYSGGWLQFIDNKRIDWLLRFIARYDFILMCITLIFETIVIFALLNKRLLISLLGFAILFHIMVVLQSGIFFWQWSLIDAAFIYLLISMHRNSNELIVSRRLPILFASFLLIATSQYWAVATRLGWHDSPVSYNYFIDVIDSNNNRTRLTPAYFSPYEYTFTLANFQFQTEQALAPVSWGATHNLPFARQLTKAKSESEIVNLLNEFSVNKYEAERTELFENFVLKYLTSKQIKAQNKYWFDFVRAPLYLYTGRQNRNPLDTEVARIEISLKTSWFNGENLIVIDDEVIRSISPRPAQ